METRTEIASFRFFPNKVDVYLSVVNDLDDGSTLFEVNRVEDWTRDEPIGCTTYKDAKAKFVELVEKELYDQR